MVTKFVKLRISIEEIAGRVEGIAAINEDRKMRNIALALNNEEIMNKILENGYPDS